MRSVNVASTFKITTGYGQLGESAVLGFKYQCGLNVHPYPIYSIDDISAQDIWSTQLTETVKECLMDHSAPLYFYGYLPDIDTFEHSNVFPGTMYESTKIPSSWVERLNRYPVVMVPTKFLVDAFKDSGVTSNIEVIPDGYDPLLYRPIKRQPKITTTLIVGPVIERKNTIYSINAWKKVFKGVTDARLVIVGSYGIDYAPDDPRITHYKDATNTRGLIQFYSNADVLLCMGAEGFGIPLLEGMATGMPVIALNAFGQSDVIEDTEDTLLSIDPYKMISHSDSEMTLGGDFPIPRLNDIADRLDWVVNNPVEALSMGQRAAEWAPQNRSIWQKMPKVYDLMERYHAWD